MLIDNPMTLIVACITGAIVLNLAMLKVSPQIGDRTRHLISGTSPTMASLAAYIGTNDSVVAYGSDLAVLGTALAGGLACAIGATKFVRPRDMLTNA